MAKKPGLSVEGLLTLGPERLAALVIDHSVVNPHFRKIVEAALAGLKGPEAVAKLIDRRLAALAKARSMVAWNKEAEVRDDLDALLKMIIVELAALSKEMAMDRLLSFIGLQENILERVVDGTAKISAVFDRAVEACGALTEQSPQAARDELPDRLTKQFSTARNGVFVQLATSVVPHLGEGVQRQWMTTLESEVKRLKSNSKTTTNRALALERDQSLDIMQILAHTLQDLDEYVRFETMKSPDEQNPFDIAERLFAAERYKDALTWVRKKGAPRYTYFQFRGVTFGTVLGEHDDVERVALEADILQRLKRLDEAQSLRWAYFEKTLNVEILRVYMNALGDFEEFEALDRAFAVVDRQKNVIAALQFYLEWPELNRAQKLVMQHRGTWRGSDYQLLAPVADALSSRHATAACVLYRLLLDHILNQGQSKAYSHASRYYLELERMAPDFDPQCSSLGLEPHQRYALALFKAHARKSAFWAHLPEVYDRFSGKKTTSKLL